MWQNVLARTLLGASLAAAAIWPALGASSDMTKTAPQSAFGEGDFGVGIGVIGGPALSVFARTEPARHVQGGLAFGPGGDFAATADYCVDHPHSFAGAPRLTPYWGGGVALFHDDDVYDTFDDDRYDGDTFLGGRIPLGLNFVIPKTPVQLGVEVAPTLLLTPTTYSYLQGDLHVRVMF